MSGAEKRLHRRISGIVAENASVQFKLGKAFSLDNISYGGFAIKREINSSDRFEEGSSHSISLNILGQSVDTDARVANIVGNRTGFSIEHSGIDALIFLRGIFEFWQNGVSARIIDGDRKKPAEAGLDRVYINGDGPTDMLLTRKTGGQCPDSLITFMSDGDYLQVECTNSVIKTGKSFGESKMPGASVRMDAQRDSKALRQAICLLAGFNLPAIRAEIDQLLELWIKEIL